MNLSSNALEQALGELDQALRAFFFRHVPASEAEDLLQECYLRVVRGLPDLEDQERLAGWVFRVARNLVIDHHRAKRAEEPVPEVASEEESGGELEARFSTWLAVLIDELPEKYSLILRESELEERPHREISERHGLSISGVKSRVQRGRARLRERLEACCRLEFDRRGGLVDAEPRNGTCAADECC